MQYFELGKSDIDDVAQIIQWNNLTTLPAWNSVSAREIRGTLAMRVHPKLKKTHKLTVFSDDYIRYNQVSVICIYNMLYCLDMCYSFMEAKEHYMELTYGIIQFHQMLSAIHQIIHLMKDTMLTITNMEC